MGFGDSAKITQQETGWWSQTLRWAQTFESDCSCPNVIKKMTYRVLHRKFMNGGPG